MNIVCQGCAARLSLPDDKIPKGVPSITLKCPKCQNPLVIDLQAPAEAPSPSPAPRQQAPTQPPAQEPPAAAPPAAEPPPEEPSAPEPPPEPEPHPEDDFKDLEDIPEDARLAMVCFDDSGTAEEVKKAMEGLDYTVHIPAKPEEGIFWLRRQKFEVVLLHQEYGGSEADNLLLQFIQPRPMVRRRGICVGLVGKELRTLDNMTAFAKSVNFVIAEEDLGKISDLTRQAVADNDKFYRAFREALSEAGKA